MHKMETSFTIGGIGNWNSHSGNQGSSQKAKHNSLM